MALDMTAKLLAKTTELPNASAYNETCASIGDVYWNQRLFLLTGESKYYDIIERTLYNGLISGISLDGKKFFYPNPLEADGEYKFNRVLPPDLPGLIAPAALQT
ncbi:MAG: glycoside hydrolase family 127 protein [Bacteroidia bacterium]